VDESPARDESTFAGSTASRRICWSANQDSELRKLAAAGYSAGAIARLLTEPRTRNAVIGRLNRLSIPLQSRGRADRQDHQAPRRRLAVRHQQNVEAASTNITPAVKAPLNGKPVTILDLKPGACRFIIASGPPSMFCGSKTYSGSSWCLVHHALCIVPMKK
jgi:hypothetical protein